MQNHLMNSPSVLNAEIEDKAHQKWLILAKAEESFFLQRSRITALELGDSNTAYYHRLTATRKYINHIHYLIDEEGNRYDSVKSIADHSVDYFEKFLNLDVPHQLFEQSDIDLLIPYRCNEAQKSGLSKDFTAEEIREAFFSLPKNKTSGPDGFTSEFFCDCWSIVGPEVTAAVSEFFTSGKLLKQWNAATLVLIPKIPNASKMADFRPISCLNTLYKVIAKLLAERLKKILVEVISPYQSAFLPGRMLGENVLLATEIIHGYNNNNVQPSGMLKVDLMKAFDSLRWDFIIATLQAIGVPAKFRDWIIECIYTPSFSVSINGSSNGYFQSSRGLRQGDPLSPYLFVLAMEVFSQLLRARFDSGYIKYHPQTEDMDISHLMFADDVMVFFDGGSSSLHGIVETLDDFASWSGLVTNFNKTQLFTAGLNLVETTAISSYGFTTGSLPVRYLGLPLMSRKLRVSEYEPLLDKIHPRFVGWAVKKLSYAGRLQLISSVISGTVIFWITTFILPKSCIRQIESLCSRFLWSGTVEGAYQAKVKWSTICLPKSEGGLGLRTFQEWNKTLYLRYTWLLFSQNSSLWASWMKRKYLGSACYWAVEERPSHSWIWKCLLKIRSLAERFIRASIGDGTSISFWFDSWSPFGPLIKYLGDTCPRDLCVPRNATVSAACNVNGWRLPNPRSDHALELHIHLTTVQPPSVSSDPDSYHWLVNGNKFQTFSSAITWEAIRPRENTKDWVKVIWYKGAVPKHVFNMWVANYDRLPTRVRLASWGMPIPTQCCLCSKFPEDRDHLLLTCEYSVVIWKWVFLRFRPTGRLFSNWQELLSWLKADSNQAPETLRRLVAHTTIYHLWKQRNNVLFNSAHISPESICKCIDKDIRNTIYARNRRKKFLNYLSLWSH